MTRSSRSPVLVGLALGLLGLGLGLYALQGSGERRQQPAAQPPVTPEEAAPLPSPQELIPPPVVERHSEEGLDDTTVLWPLQVDLDLLQPDYLPTGQDIEAVGSGRDAELSGRIAGRSGEGVAAEVHFVAGPNAGTVLHCDSTGGFGSSTLYPGLALVEVRGPGIIARREVRLRQRTEALLNLGFGRLAAVYGTVVDFENRPVAGAEINFDGHVVLSADDGGFFVSDVAGGQVPVEVAAPGFAAFREMTYVVAGSIVSREKLTYHLQPAASLRVSIPDRIGGPGPVQVFLLPDRIGGAPRTENKQQGVPWHRFNPIEVPAGSAHVIEGLPPTSVRVLAFRPGALAQQKLVNLQPGEANEVTIRMDAAPMLSGRVLDEGRPVAGARVSLEAPNRVKATLSFFIEPSIFLESEVLPDLPPAAQQVLTGDDGRFVLSAWQELSAVRYLEALSPDGRKWAGRLVGPGTDGVDLELESVELGDATLVLSFPDRWQGLPVELSINGAPVEPCVVPAYEPLRIDALLAGRWQLRATWHAELVQPEVAFELSGETEREIRLPPEAIQGQDEEAWRRAGREFPFN